MLVSARVKITSSLRHLAAWIACLAILMAALVPTLSQALAAARGSSDTWMEICSAGSTKFVKVAASDTPGEPAPAGPAMQMVHCPFSRTHAGALDNEDSNGFAYQGSSKYFTTDLRVRYQLAKQWTASFGIDNLNNYQYWNFHPYPQRSDSTELKFDL